MFRTAIVVLLTLLCCALGLVAYGGYRSQRQMAEQMAALAAELKALADQQKEVVATPPPAAEPKPLEITGKVFVGSPDQPLANTEAMICRVNDGEIVRRISTKADGTFESGPLTAGDYTVVADGVKDPSWKDSIAIQTAPMYLYPNSPTTSLAIDAAYRGGQIAVKLSRPLPKLTVEGKYKIDSRLYLRATPSPSSLRKIRWTVAEPPPEHWPIYIQHAERSPATADQAGKPSLSVSGSAILSNQRLIADPHVKFSATLNPLPAGTCRVQASVVADVAPDGPVDADKMIFNNRGGYRVPDADRQWMSDYWAVNETLGQVWFFTLAKQQSPKTPYTSLSSLNHTYLPNLGTRTEVPIADGGITSLLVEVPDDLESRIQHLVETVTDPYEFKEAVVKENPFVRDAKITVISSGPLAGHSP